MADWSDSGIWKSASELFNLSDSAKVRWNHGVRVHSGLVFWRHRFTKIGWIRAERDKRAPRALHLRCNDSLGRVA